MNRLGLGALLDYAGPGDTLAVVRLDPLGPSLAELLATVVMLKERGIALLSLEEKIDTSSAAGELVFHVFGAIAHFERRLIAKRTRDGIAAARVRGKHPGRQRPLRVGLSGSCPLQCSRPAPLQVGKHGPCLTTAFPKSSGFALSTEHPTLCLFNATGGIDP